MKNMKKRIGCLLTLCILFTAFSTVALAEGTSMSENLANSLVVHYDFNGDTLEEQLSDKATGGVSKENLTLYTTQDDNNKDLSYVKDGVLHIDHAEGNSAKCLFAEAAAAAGATDAAPGTDITEATELTMIIEFEMLAKNTKFVDMFDVHNVARMYASYPKGSGATYSPIWLRFTSDAYGSDAHEWRNAKDNTVYHGADHVIMAVSVKYDGNAQKIDITSNFSFDNGKSFATATTSFDNIESYFINCGSIHLGKSPSSWEDRNGVFDIYDVRIYNKVLSTVELKAVAESLDSNQNAGGDTDDGNQGGSISEVTEPVGNAGSDTKPGNSGTVTDAPKDSGTLEPAAGSDGNGTGAEQKGCSSVLAVGGTQAFALLACAFLFLRKKKA